LVRDVLRHHPLNAPKPIGWCRMHALLFLAALSSSGGAAPASLPCNPIPGWNAIDQRRDLDFLVIGEMHGSSETPDLRRCRLPDRRHPPRHRRGRAE
jgi:hypothetical protein